MFILYMNLVAADLWNRIVFDAALSFTVNLDYLYERLFFINPDWGLMLVLVKSSVLLFSHEVICGLKGIYLKMLQKIQGQQIFPGWRPSRWRWWSDAGLWTTERRRSTVRWWCLLIVASANVSSRSQEPQRSRPNSLHSTGRISSIRPLSRCTTRSLILWWRSCLFHCVHS